MRSYERTAIGVLLQALFLFAGCRHGSGGSSGESAPETATIQVTVWGERFEVFLEHAPPVAGSPVTFITHVTDLETFAPRASGPITYALRRDGREPVETVVPAPERPGIYTPDIVFPAPGEWRVTVRVPCGEDEAELELPPVRVHATTVEARAAPVAEPPDGIVFLKESQWKMKVETRPVARRRLTERLALAGTVQPHPGGKASVAPLVAGRLRPPPGESLPTLGQHVGAGDVLAIVEPPFSEFTLQLVAAEAETARAELALALAERTHERAKALAEKNATSTRELDAARFELETARERIEASRRIQRAYRSAGAVHVEEDGLLGFELRSPISGTVTRVGVVAGERTDPERDVFTVVDLNTVHIVARAPEAGIARIASAGRALYETPARPGELHPTGQLVFSGLEVDPATRTVPLVFETSGATDRLRIGMSVTVHVETDRAEDALALPSSAIVEDSGRAVVFVMIAGETFEQREVETGIRDGESVEVRSGLEQGERVVTRGAYAVRLASASGALPAHGHAH